MAEIDERLPPEVARVLRSAGWSPERDTSSSVDEWARRLGEGFPIFPAARDALRRYGGLRVRQEGPGDERARESFDLDPVHCVMYEDEFAEYGARLSTRLYPLGEAGGGHVFLAIAEDGRVYAFMEDLWLIGETIDDAIVALVKGRAAKLISA